MKRCLSLLAMVLLLPPPAAARECNPRLIRSAPDGRYDLSVPGVVTDLRTGLTWQRCPLGTTWDDGGTPDLPHDDRCLPTGTTAWFWQEALQAAAALNGAGGLAGFTDWRLPNAKELASLLEVACWGPAINPRAFPETPAGTFYSSTPYIQGTVTSTSVHGCTFAGTGACLLVGKASTRRWVRLVRG